MNNTYDVNIQTEIRSLKWIMYKVHKEYMYALKSGIIASFFRELKETKQRFYRKSKAEKKENYGEFQLSKVKLNEKKEEKLKKMFLQKQRIYPRLSQVYYLLCRQGLFTILKKRIRYYMKNFFNRIAKICLVLFNFNSQSSAYISASLAKRRFELKFSKKEVSMMLYHVTQEYVSGFYAVLAGRFTKNIRATKEQHLFGKVSSNSIAAPIDYHQTTAIIRYGASSTKLQLAFQNYTLLGAVSENHKSIFRIYRNRVLFFTKSFGNLIKKIKFPRPQAIINTRLLLLKKKTSFFPFFW